MNGCNQISEKAGSENLSSDWKRPAARLGGKWCTKRMQFPGQNSTTYTRGAQPCPTQFISNPNQTHLRQPIKVFRVTWKLKAGVFD